MIIERVKMDIEDVRNKCIEKNWYTCGDNEEYSHMLNMTKEPYSVILLEKIARNIVEHSDEECWEGYDDSPVLNVMFELKADCCYSFFEEV